MAWEIEWSPKAFKALKSFPFHVRERIVKKVGELGGNPFRLVDHSPARFTS